jgi:hypothetical protein
VASGQRRRAVAVKVFVEIADEAGTTASQTFDYSAERGRHPSFETLIEGAMTVIDRVSKGAQRAGSVTFRVENDG